MCELSEKMALVHLHAASIHQFLHSMYEISAARSYNNRIDAQRCTCRGGPKEVADAVRRLDTRVLSSAEEVRAILACAPAAEERKMFEAFLHSGGKPEALSDAERFCLEMMQVRDLLLLPFDDACLLAGRSHERSCTHMIVARGCDAGVSPPASGVQGLSQ